MKKLRTFLARYRLISSALALAFMLATLSLSSPKSDAFICEGGMICGRGCVNWTQSGGCSDCQYCCACGEEFHCESIPDRTCEFSMD
jgi:hypothetical protein